MINAIIIDDEPAAIEVIRSLAAHLSPDLVIKDEALDGISAVNKIINIRPDLIFLDVDLPMMNGLDIMEKVQKISFETIFTTGSAGYALNAIKLNAVDYLIKPIDPADFILAIQKTRERIDLKNKPL